MAVERRAKVEQSVTNFMRSYLLAQGYDLVNDVSIVDALTDAQFTGKLDKSYIASGYNQDDGGRQAELGSDFTRRIYTIEYIVYGQSPLWGQNLALAIEACFEVEGVVPVIDIAGTGSATGEFVYVEYSQAQRAVVRQPRPFEQHVWITRARFLDEYYASQQ